ncbi:hypothetical protein PFICI_04565 [Pestalotiopsis fici W106-1]|uniref:Carboxylic ester hydrolase n=1 Tax=Pestalotiopsis fici (strain W106-1 / CGMCC3.15140) TaxID=1229662 RepID=W3X9H6_PESFW|nr:uncharacterized protein PFICI_04565 [Pestalotiopsis fici W106-1]ETS82689.1 hypothetical protein PFICI_04565 [Pestalotiopsis fici W106-1]
MAIDFVLSHIADFGGDPGNVTLAGESAGAVYCHAHMAIGSPVRQCILQSGSLYLSPPQPRTNGSVVIGRLEGALSNLGKWTMRDAPVQKLLEAQAELGLVSFFLQAEEPLDGWETKHGSVERLLIGDTEYEAVLWHNGMQELSAPQIAEAFELAGSASADLSRLYGIVKDRPSACKYGALDFLNDARFVLPVEMMTETWQEAKCPVFRFLVDQPNPWQSSSRAHHAVDLLYVFGAFDLSFNPAAQAVSIEMQKKWIEFIQGQNPWQPGGYWTFGPHGESQSIDDKGFAARRRNRHLDALKSLGPEVIDPVYKALAAGRLSLLN